VSDLGKVLSLWKDASATGEDYVLATVVSVEGSSYRKPGARMLITKSGRRAGTISGGCLEAELTSKAWWYSEAGPNVRRFSTSFDVDDDAPPYGMGCGGVVYVLLERRATAEVLLRRLFKAFDNREAFGVTTVLEGAAAGTHIFADQEDLSSAPDTGWFLELKQMAQHALQKKQSSEVLVSADSQEARKVWAEYVAPRIGLLVFGAGDDARPLVTQAHTLGWYVAVADGRSHLASRERFPEADSITVLTKDQLPPVKASDAGVLVTHSYEQDLWLLKKLLVSEIGYLGLLGPRHRTDHLLGAIAQELGGSPEEYLMRLHSPTGLDLGADSPASIALSIIAEIQAHFHRASGAPLRDVKPQQEALRVARVLQGA
jgi:xanthine/CO dehydrogenase XdhC/CoxF family maturation factor